MKKLLSMLMVFTLLASLFCALAVPASADSYDAWIDGEVGMYFDQRIYSCPYTGGRGVVVGYNDCPSWLTLYEKSDGSIWARGTPESVSYCTVQISVSEWRYSGGEYIPEAESYIYLTINVSSGPGLVNLPGETRTLQYGKAYDEDFDQLSSGGEIFDHEVSGTLPKGLDWDGYDSYIRIYGTPTESGTFYVTLSALDDHTNNYIHMSVTLVVKGGALAVTKDPSPDPLTEGDTALFISAAENYSKVEWRIVTKDGNNCWRGESEIESKFPGVEFSSWEENGKEYMQLKNIPYSMNGYYVQTKFWSNDQSTFALTKDHACLLNIKEYTCPAPTIKEQPAGNTLDMGTPISLQVMAEAKEGTLNYQWYSNDKNSTSGGSKISGATSWKCSADMVEGTRYYYCAVTATNKGKTSTVVYTDPVAVIYNPVATPAPSASPAPSAAPAVSPEPSQAPAVATPEPTAKPSSGINKNDPEPQKNSDHTVLFVIAGTVCVALVCGTVIYLKKRR